MFGVNLSWIKLCKNGSGRAEAGEAREWKDWFNPKDGEWRLVLRFYTASGRYGVKLATR